MLHDLEPFFLFKVNNHNSYCNNHRQNNRPESVWIINKRKVVKYIHSKNSSNDSQWKGNKRNNGQNPYDAAGFIGKEALIGTI